MQLLSGLAAAAAGGDAAAISDLVEQVWPDAYRIAWSVLGDRAAAEDAAQDACARLLTAISTLRNPEAFGAWFYRIVVNEANRRRRQARQAASVGELSTQADRIDHDDRIDLERALRALDQKLRVALILRYYFNLSGDRIARIVGCSPLTVRWRLFMGRKRLRAILEPPHTSSASPMRTRIGDYADQSQTVR